MRDAMISTTTTTAAASGLDFSVAMKSETLSISYVPKSMSHSKSPHRLSEIIYGSEPTTGLATALVETYAPNRRRLATPSNAKKSRRDAIDLAPDKRRDKKLRSEQQHRAKHTCTECGVGMMPEETGECSDANNDR